MESQTFSALLVKVNAEWRSNVRLRVGVYVLLGIFWLYGVLLLKDVVAAERTAWASMESKIARARTTAAAADWSTRAQEVKAAVADLETLLWREGSVGLSQASFEERVSQSLAQAGMTLRSIRTTAATDGAGTAGQLGLIELRARVQTDFRAATMYPWLSTIGRQRFDKASTIFVESLIIRGASFGQPATAEIELVGYAVKANSGTTKGSIIQPGAGASQ
jgi:hypothetical protein